MTLSQAIGKWKGTPYVAGQCMPGRGVDCVRFVDAVLQDWRGVRLAAMPRLPQDMSLHDRAGAVRMMRMMLERHPLEDTDVVVPGTVIVYRRGDSPGHVLIAGPGGKQLWHADGGIGVCYTSALEIMGHVYAMRRPKWTS